MAEVQQKAAVKLRGIGKCPARQTVAGSFCPSIKIAFRYGFKTFHSVLG
jgi:hypothetical protein